ncbi:autotransporter outer membrane beta-barrel domain-containing protein [Glaesserella parasuis]|nr:autotransporter outer membrane beta-barrel domain-containing protein [Glaesserella parasuis]
MRSVGTVSRSAENTSANLDKVLDEVAKNPTSSIKADSVSIINAKPMSVASTVESLSAEIYASSQNMIVNENRLFSQNIAERAFHSLQDEKSDVYAVTNRQSYQISQNGYANAEIEGNQSYVGADKQTDRLLFGISAYHSRQKADFERTAGSAKLHQQGGAIYAGYQLDNNYLLAQLGMANAKNKIKRSILMPNETRRVETEVKSKLYHFYTELGHRIKFEQGEISPFIGYQFDSVYQKAFDEGKNFGIQANRTQYNLNSYLLGLRATMKWGDLSLNTTLSHRMTQKAENAFGFNARYIGAESEIELQGISPAKYVTMAKLGLNYQISEALHLFGEYAIARQKGGEKWQNVSVGMKYQF